MWPSKPEIWDTQGTHLFSFYFQLITQTMLFCIPKTPSLVKCLITSHMVFHSNLPTGFSISNLACLFQFVLYVAGRVTSNTNNKSDPIIHQLRSHLWFFHCFKDSFLSMIWFGSVFFAALVPFTCSLLAPHLPVLFPSVWNALRLCLHLSNIKASSEF